jgi:hypothetical protein
MRLNKLNLVARYGQTLNGMCLSHVDTMLGYVVATVPAIRTCAWGTRSYLPASSSNEALFNIMMVMTVALYRILVYETYSLRMG